MMKDSYTTLCVFSMKKNAIHVRSVLVACLLTTCTCCCAVSSTGGDARPPDLHEKISNADTLDKLIDLLRTNATQCEKIETIIKKITECDNVASLDNIIENLNGSLGGRANLVLAGIRRFVTASYSTAEEVESRNLNTVIGYLSHPPSDAVVTSVDKDYRGKRKVVSALINWKWNNPLTIQQLADAASREEIAKYVVRVSRLSVTPGGVPFNTEIGTGTLIDLGIQELKGRVVLTATHCLKGRGPLTTHLEWIRPEDGQRYFKQNWNDRKVDFGSSQYLSVRQSLPTEDFPDLVTQADHLRENPIVLFCCDGEVGVAILKDQIRVEDGIEEYGLRLPSAVEDAVACRACCGSGKIVGIGICQFCLGYGTDTSGYIISKLDNGWKGISRSRHTPQDTTDFVVGYGWSGLNDEMPDPWILRDTGVAMLSSKLNANAIQLAKLFGWNRKKLADVTVSLGVDKQLHFNVDGRSIESSVWTGCGFSGALAVNRDNHNKRKLLGTLSGNTAKDIVKVLREIIQNKESLVHILRTEHPDFFAA